MHKNSRMMMAEAIQNSYRGTTRTQKNGLKDIIKHINESILIDCILANTMIISQKTPMLLSNLTSKIASAIASEVLYSLFTENLTPTNIKSFDALLAKCNIHVNRNIKSSNHTTRNNLLPIILKIDQKMIHRSHSYHKLFSDKNKKYFVSHVKKKIKLIRPLILSILCDYNKESHSFEIFTSQSKKFKPTLSVLGIKPTGTALNYMSKTPNTFLDIKCGLPKDRISIMTQSINTILNMPFTFDDDYNTMITSIMDKPLFTELLAGKSTDVQSVSIKVAQAITDITEGLDYWGDVGKGKVYFNYVVDFRGRISQLGGLSAVGNKVCKAMVRSGHAHELGEHGYNELLIALAGAVGYDKETFAVRLAWAKENVAEYEQIGKNLIDNPVDGFDQLRGTDDPFACASICLELVRIAEHPDDVSTYCSNIFIGYDATSSAVQLVGLLMGNEKLTEASNVRVGVDTEDRIHDSYMLLADIMDTAAPKFIDDENRESLEMWLAFSPREKRAFAKPLLMTRLYGSRLITHMDSVRAIAIDGGLIDANDAPKLRRFGMDIAMLFNSAFNNEEGFNCLRSYEIFVKEISAAYNEKGTDTIWSIQDNSVFEPQLVVSSYRKFKGEKYVVYMDGKKREMRTYSLDILGECATELDYTENRILNKSKALSSIAPNFIHSHDALVLHATVVKLNQPMRLTHDCFATTPGMVHEMKKCINDVYVDLFGDNKLKQLEALQEECLENTGILVDLPANYNRDGIPSNEIAKAGYKFS